MTRQIKMEEFLKTKDVTSKTSLEEDNLADLTQSSMRALETHPERKTQEHSE